MRAKTKVKAKTPAKWIMSLRAATRRWRAGLLSHDAFHEFLQQHMAADYAPQKAG